MRVDHRTMFPAGVHALTKLPRTGAPDEVLAAQQVQFAPPEIAAVAFAIIATNSWNRLAVTLSDNLLSLDALDLPEGADAQPASGGA